MAFVDASDGRHDLTGGAEPALKRVLIDERLLDRMELTLGCQALDRRARRPSSDAIRIMQAFTRRPSTRGVHVPHSPRLHPFLVPVKRARSRRKSRSVTRVSTPAFTESPLIHSATDRVGACCEATVGEPPRFASLPSMIESGSCTGFSCGMGWMRSYASAVELNCKGVATPDSERGLGDLANSRETFSIAMIGPTASSTRS